MIPIMGKKITLNCDVTVTNTGKEESLPNIKILGELDNSLPHIIVTVELDDGSTGVHELSNAIDSFSGRPNWYSVLEQYNNIKRAVVAANPAVYPVTPFGLSLKAQYIFSSTCNINNRFVLLNGFSCEVDFTGLTGCTITIPSGTEMEITYIKYGKTLSRKTGVKWKITKSPVKGLKGKSLFLETHNLEEILSNGTVA